MRHTLFAAALAASVATAATAGTVTGYIFTDQSAASMDATLAQFTALGGAAGANATFTFNGTANFTGSGNSNVDTIDQFLASGGVAAVGGTTGSHTLTDSYFYFTGSVGLNAGNNTFTITHDDGFTFNIDGIGLVVNQPGPTAPVATTFVVTAPTAGNYNFQFAYGECCGGPAQITVLGGTLIPAPEPASVALLGMGVLGAAFGLRRRAR